MVSTRLVSSIGTRLNMAEGRCLPAKVSHLKNVAIPLAFQTPANSFIGVLNATQVQNIASRIIDSHVSFSGEIKMVEIGKTPGENPLETPQPIWGIEVLPGGPIHKTAVFCAGHHIPEYAGPHANLHLLDQFLIGLQTHRSILREMFKGAALLFIPLANPDGAMLTDDGEFTDYLLFGNPVGEDNRVVDNNAYTTYHPEAILKPEALAIKKHVEAFVARFGKPFFALDFHESKNHLPCSETRKNRYLFAPLHVTLAEETQDGEGLDAIYAVHRDIIDEAIGIYGDIISNLVMMGEPKTKFTRRKQTMVNFSEMMSLMGADSYLVETPNHEKHFHVGDRVMMAMLATEMFLAKIRASN